MKDATFTKKGRRGGEVEVRSGQFHTYMWGIKFGRDSWE